MFTSMDKITHLSTDNLRALSTWLGNSETENHNSPELQIEQIVDDFQVIATAEKVLKTSSSQSCKVALQFPDDLLPYAPVVCAALQLCTADLIRHHSDDADQAVFYFILGDTSYGECCVDEVAAEHLNADLVVHYGNACLSPTRSLPVLYVFPRFRFSCPELASSTFRSSLESLLSQDSIDEIVIMFDIELVSCFSDGHAQFNDISVGLDFVSKKVRVQVASIRQKAWLNVVNQNFQAVQDECKRIQVGPHEYRDTATPIDRISFIWFTRNGCIDDWPSATRNAALSLCTGPQDHCAGFFGSSLTVSAEAMPNLVDSSRLLRKRFSLLEKAQNAQRIGIVPGTLGVLGSVDIIERCKRIARSAGKRAYVMLVGKPNPSKLANFGEIDLFVLVACPQNALLDGREYMKPIITPLELEAALISGGDIFSSPYSTDFRDLLSKKLELEDASPNAPGDADGSTVAVRGDWSVSVTGEGSGAEYLRLRHWQGLSYSNGGIDDETPIADLPLTPIVGQTGIANKYDNEGE